ncbi:general glycosylation pathway protein [Pseudoalteromonas sp. SCSIO 43101]|uniref:general glycosylation pathway protein n=1 Tax=Pseudoalteromonas sp. SCSIO 43101 TaxID=2822847 RepID=UPI0015C09601|nr:general glycosylation pathway protein [Pseudoalteromonas sp. SCSIO 43101]QLE09822.1 general glycosylation pathway protein [Pseudoalteromonas shioyasakiensis]QWV06338.1 general glycosylation pathway protein [Pseudoalteromonas shioyasakiensis]URQ89312.1 general glycosylation pathway protein [Pseudoalteromonas sp. SCSIO 43101]
MARMSYLSAIERYEEQQVLIHNLLLSILASVQASLTNKQEYQQLVNQYPFLELQYCLNEQGIQQGYNVCFKRQYKKKLAHVGAGQDLSARPYFLLASASPDPHFTSPYISTATKHLCISVIKMIPSEKGKQQFLVIDVCLTELIEFIMGDIKRARMTPYFRVGYGLIVGCLFCLVIYLLYKVFAGMVDLVLNEDIQSDPLKPFTIIIFVTLALAIFDLGKTILEEEILMHKDIFRHSSTRRTITRFISTILIAVSIEALLTMFKAALGQTEYVIPAVLMMFAVVGLLIALAIYVYLGAKAEDVLTQVQRLKVKH